MTWQRALCCGFTKLNTFILSVQAFITGPENRYSLWSLVIFTTSNNCPRLCKNCRVNTKTFVRWMNINIIFVPRIHKSANIRWMNIECILRDRFKIRSLDVRDLYTWKEPETSWYCRLPVWTSGNGYYILPFINIRIYFWWIYTYTYI